MQLLIGVIVGGILTGAVQVALDLRKARTDARVAAALVYGDIDHATQSINAWLLIPSALLPHADLAKLRLSDYLPTWVDQREAFARGIKPLQFHTVAGAFAGLAMLSRAVDARPEEVHGLPRLELLQIAEQLDVAGKIAWVASGMPLDTWQPPPKTPLGWKQQETD
jgi:hypothetical protein